MARNTLLCALVALLWLIPSVTLADCHVRQGEHVALFSEAGDPSVFVWDTRLRLRDYHAASFDEAQALLPHALLVDPGTRAIVVTCVPGYVQSRFIDSGDDAIGVIIVSGLRRGSSGWVLGSDVRPASHPHH
jgi:hypothetical protein